MTSLPWLLLAGRSSFWPLLSVACSDSSTRALKLLSWKAPLDSHFWVEFVNLLGEQDRPTELKRVEMLSSIRFTTWTSSDQVIWNTWLAVGGCYWSAVETRAVWNTCTCWNSVDLDETFRHFRLLFLRFPMAKEEFKIRMTKIILPESSISCKSSLRQVSHFHVNRRLSCFLVKSVSIVQTCFELNAEDLCFR